MSQSKPRVVKVHSSKSSSERLSSDFQGAKQKLKTPKRTNNRPARKPSPQGSRKQNNASDGVVNAVEDVSSKAEVARMNLKTLQNIDGGISKILCTIPLVELYRYKGYDNMWERTTYEGTLFVFLRELVPKGSRGFMILNRLNSENTQENINPGMEFREQSPFLLYKRDNSGDIFGLCIKEEQDFAQASKLLNRLSDESTSPASYDVSSSISPSPNTTGGSQSPVFHSEGPPISVEEGVVVGGVKSGRDVDLQEVINHAYLGGHCFSDDTEGSIDGVELPSPPKASDKENLPHRLSGSNISSRDSSVSYSKVNPVYNITYCQPVSSFPQQIPLASVAGSNRVTSANGHAQMSLQGKQSRTPDFKLTAHRDVNSLSSHSNHYMVQHATSLDEGRGHVVTQYGRSPILGHLSNGFSSSMGEFSPHQKGELSRSGNSSHVSMNNSHDAGVRDDTIVRKLFSAPVPAPSDPVQDGISPAVLTLFSRANGQQDAASYHTSSSMPSSYLSSSLGSSSHMSAMLSQRMQQSSALSLDEVEKQMKEEPSSAVYKSASQDAHMTWKTGGVSVSHHVSPVSTSGYGSAAGGMMPLAALTSAHNRSTSHQSSTHQKSSHLPPPTQSVSSRPNPSTYSMSSHLPPSQPAPSHFLPPTQGPFSPPTHIVTYQLPPRPSHPVSSNLPPVALPPTQLGEDSRLVQPSAFSVSSGTMAPTSSTTVTSRPLLLPSSLSNMSAITVEPPTPVSIPSKASLELGEFPSIPPLMHSPGMMAPPLNRSTGSKSSIKKAANEGSIPKRASSADSESSSSQCVWSQLSPPSPPEKTPNQSSTAPRRSKTAPNNSTLMSPQQFLECRPSGPVASDREHSEADLVSKDQFQQTLMYLLQNDKSFVDKIYETHRLLVQSSAPHQL